MWCLPGGHIEKNEIAITAIIREVKEETGLDFNPKFFNYFDEIIEDKKIHAVTLVYTGISKGNLVKKNDEINDAQWVPIKDALNYELAFKHYEIIKHYQENKTQEPVENSILQELKYLRDEILYRFETRNRMIYFAILLAGIILTFGKPEGFILYPILGTILAGLWSHSDIRIAEIGEYIKTQIEPKIKGLNWENHLFDKYKNSEKLAGKIQEKFVLWVFYSTYLIMFLLSVFKLIPSILKIQNRPGFLYSNPWLCIILLAVGFIITIISMYFTRKYIKKRRRMYLSN